jgi:hypothetical protein
MKNLSIKIIDLRKLQNHLNIFKALSLHRKTKNNRNKNKILTYFQISNYCKWAHWLQSDICLYFMLLRVTKCVQWTLLLYIVMKLTVMSAWIRSRDKIHLSRCILVCRFRIYTHFLTLVTIWGTLGHPKCHFWTLFNK